MTYYPVDPARREAFITGLRALADYLAVNPDVPVPAYTTRIQVCADRTDNGGCAQVDEFARQLGAAAEDRLADCGHYEAARSFGPLDYRMVAISSARMARHDAYNSYAGSVIP